VDAVVAATEANHKSAPASTAAPAAKPPAGKPAAVAKPAAKSTSTPAAKSSTPAATVIKPAATAEEGPQNTSRPDPRTLIQAKFSALLTAVTPRADFVEEPLRGDLVAEMIGVAHRGDVCKFLSSISPFFFG
jgi:hypothetical protein